MQTLLWSHAPVSKTNAVLTYSLSIGLLQPSMFTTTRMTVLRIRYARPTLGALVTRLTRSIDMVKLRTQLLQ